jgi:putative addiction module component (TIGR02574 family)
MKLKEVRESALSLPRRSREKLARELFQSVENEQALHACPPGMLSEDDPDFQKIIQERINAYDRGEDKGVPWEEVQKWMKERMNAGKALKRR